MHGPILADVNSSCEASWTMRLGLEVRIKIEASVGVEIGRESGENRRSMTGSWTQQRMTSDDYHLFHLRHVAELALSKQFVPHSSLDRSFSESGRTAISKRVKTLHVIIQAIFH